MATLLSSDTDARWLPLSCQATPHTCTPRFPAQTMCTDSNSSPPPL